MRTVSVKSAARVLDLLELVSTLREGIGVNALARRLAMPNSSASALVATLEGRGYLKLAADGYRLAEAYREGGWIGGTQALLLRAAQPAMQRLTAATGESSFLGVLTRGNEVRYLHKAVSQNPLRYDVDLSLIRPAYSISCGIVMLAGMSDEACNAYLGSCELVAVTPRTIADPDALRRMIRRARKLGYARMADSHVMGTSGVAAPIRRGDRVVAGLAVIAPTHRFELQPDAIVAATVAAAAEIGEAIPQ
ncbi:MAG: IclR family transcriptional regulator [Lautropia sp.]